MKNKPTALVTGGSRGIGRATVIKLSENGYDVVFTYRQNKDLALETASRSGIPERNVLQCDVSDPQSVEKLFEHLETNKEDIDVVVNNAGIAEHHPIDMTDEAWLGSFRKQLEVNLLGAAHVAKKAISRMDSGTIINVSSRGAYRGEPVMPGYGASKAGMNALTQSLALAVGNRNISVIGVAPGFVATDMAQGLLTEEELNNVKAQSPLNRIAEPEEVASLIAYLATPEAKHLSGAIVDINGASYFR